MPEEVIDEGNCDPGSRAFQPMLPPDHPAFEQAMKMDEFDIVTSRQVHSENHNPTCFKYDLRTCRFRFPRALVPRTVFDETTGVILQQRDHQWLNNYNRWFLYCQIYPEKGDIMASPRIVWREGVIAGLLGAAGVALWILAVDTVAGHPLHTPALLGKAMLSVLGRGIENHDPAFFVVAVHDSSRRGIHCRRLHRPSVLLTATGRAPQFTAGLALFFAVLQMGFYFLALSAVVRRKVLGALSWYQIGAANLVASLMMGRYLLRHHPEFVPNLSHALDGSNDGRVNQSCALEADR